jgi:hypothetical protein
MASSSMPGVYTGRHGYTNLTSYTSVCSVGLMNTTGTANHTSHCLRCGRALRAASSVRVGYGAWCRAKIRAAALTGAVKDFSARQIDKARELIADGGLIRTNREGIYRAVASTGSETYMVSAAGNCNCKAGLIAKYRCYHAAAAQIMQATRRA